MRSLTASATADAGKGAALTAVLSLVVGFVPLVSVLAVPLLPLPTAYVGVTWGERPALAGGGVAGRTIRPGQRIADLCWRPGWAQRWVRACGEDGVLPTAGVSTGVAALACSGSLAWWLSGLTTAQLKSLMERRSTAPACTRGAESSGVHRRRTRIRARHVGSIALAVAGHLALLGLALARQ